MVFFMENFVERQESFSFLPPHRLNSAAGILLCLL